MQTTPTEAPWCDDAGKPCRHLADECPCEENDWWEAQDMRQEQEREEESNEVLRACHSPGTIIGELAQRCNHAG